MQNLTARYNYIYNSNIILANHQTELAESYTDNYDRVLPLYLGPAPEDQIRNQPSLKPMEDIIKKAQVIILEKGSSNYVDEAYLLLGKANFFNGNYFNAIEYFDYTAKTYQQNTISRLEALNWKARSLMQLRHISEARQVLDTLEDVFPLVKTKKKLADPYATLAQMYIYLKNDEAAITYLKQGIRTTSQTQNRIRWTYALAQLLENQENYKEAAVNYRKVQRSNAPFEMYFNANLSQLRLSNLQDIQTTDNQKALLTLLKDDKNMEYADQIYFQVAENKAAKGAYEAAEKFYLLSIQKSTTNLYQKGLSYLRIADLNLRHFKNYLKAKIYYDSTVNTLPKSYPGYDLILKKNQNLMYLTSRLETIATEDTLQSIALQPEANRAALIKAFVNPAKPASIQNAGPAATHSTFPVSITGTDRNQAQNTFYFSNPAAVSTGFNDFKKKWGNRKLENNWRQSIRSSAQETTQDIANNGSLPSDPDRMTVPAAPDEDVRLTKYMQSLPLTPELRAASNQKIIDAYFQIASFYLQELEDPKEAALNYLTLLKRFPVNNHLAAIYYSLYLINRESNEVQANEYKNKILTAFPSSSYAKSILDPSFSAKQSELETSSNKEYNQIFSLYTKKEFKEVIRQTDKNQQTGQSRLAPQFAYLKAIAIGRTNPIDSLIPALEHIIISFPDDELITPLAKEHLSYIQTHLEDFKKRQVAITDFDPGEPPLPSGQQNSLAKVTDIPRQTAERLSKSEEKKDPPVSVRTTPAEITESSKSIQSEGPFSIAKSTIYYYVIAISDASLTLSSSRFGIGQFNRGRYAGSNLRHQLKEFDNEQLIYVGNFSNFEDVKTYSKGITPQLKQIMKVPVSSYTSFIISKENFEKLSSKFLLDQYLEFYNKNYQQ